MRRLTDRLVAGRGPGAVALGATALTVGGLVGSLAGAGLLVHELEPPAPENATPRLTAPLVVLDVTRVERARLDAARRVARGVSRPTDVPEVDLGPAELR